MLENSNRKWFSVIGILVVIEPIVSVPLQHLLVRKTYQKYQVYEPAIVVIKEITNELLLNTWVIVNLALLIRFQDLFTAIAATIAADIVVGTLSSKTC